MLLVQKLQANNFVEAGDSSTCFSIFRLGDGSNEFNRN